MFSLALIYQLLISYLVSADPIKLFKDWLVANGAEIDKVDWPSYKTGSGVRGSVASVKIRASEPYVRIPSNLWLWEPNFRAHAPELASYLKQERNHTTTTTRTCLFILHELTKGRKSFYYPMFHFLNEVDLLTQWSDQELTLLDDETLIGIVKREQKQIYDWYQSYVVNKFLPTHTDIYANYKEQFSYYHYRLILDVVYSRGFGGDDEDPENDAVSLVPFAETFNHANVYAQPYYQYDNRTNQSLFMVYRSKLETDPIDMRYIQDLLLPSNDSTAINTTNTTTTSSSDSSTVNDISSVSNDNNNNHDSSSSDNNKAELEDVGDIKEEYLIQEGDELYYNYGHVDNHDLLFGYGFNTLDNLWEKYVLDAEIIASEDEWYKKKDFILFEYHQFYLHEAYSFKRLNYPFEALCVSRLMEATTNEVSDIIIKHNATLIYDPETNEYYDESTEVIFDHYDRPLHKRVNANTLNITMHSYMNELAGVKRLLTSLNEERFIYEGNDEISSLDELLHTYYHIYHGNYTLWNTGDLSQISKNANIPVFPICNMSELYDILQGNSIIDVMFNIPSDPITPDYITVYDDISRRYLNMSKYMSQTCIRPFRLMSILVYHITYKRILKIAYERISRLTEWLGELNTTISQMIQNTQETSSTALIFQLNTILVTATYIDTTAHYLYYTPTFLTPDLTHPEFIPILNTTKAKAHHDDDPYIISTQISLVKEYIRILIDKTIDYHLGNTASLLPVEQTKDEL